MRPALVLLALLLSPLSASEPAPSPGLVPAAPAETTLYLHGGLGGELPLSTAAPGDDVWTGRTGIATHTNTCVPLPVPPFVAGDHHTWYLYHAMGVRIDEPAPDEDARFASYGRGLSHAVDLAPDPLRLTWSIESDLLGGADTGAPEPPAPSPAVVLRATLREGDDMSIDHTAMDAGRLLAFGETAPATLAGPATDAPHVAYTPVEADGETHHVYDLTVDLEPTSTNGTRIADGFNVRVDLFVENPACDGRTMTNTVLLHGSPGHHSTLTLGVLEPLRVDDLAAHFTEDAVVFQATVQSPWGNLDVLGADAAMTDAPDGTQGTHPDALRFAPALRINGPVGAEATPTAFTVYRNEHDHFAEGVTLSWTWDRTDAPDGAYTAQLRVENLQRNAEARATAAFTLGAEQTCATAAGGDHHCVATGVQSPGVGVAVLLAGLLVAGARRRT